MFKADDPETFAMRIKFAVDFRKEIENNLRFVAIPHLIIPYVGFITQQLHNLKALQKFMLTLYVEIATQP